MRKLDSGPGFMYWGTHRGWLVFNAIVPANGEFERVVDESNQRTLIRRLKAVRIAECNDCEDEDGPHAGGYSVESFSGFGGSTALLINPNHAGALGIASLAEADTDDYPILDEADWSELEYEESLSGLEEFIRCEYGKPWGGSDNFDLAGFIFGAWNETIGLERWPDLDNHYDREMMAAALREWRKYRRERIQVAA